MFKVFRAHKARKVLKDPGRKDHKGGKVLQVSKDGKAAKGHKAFRDLKAHRVDKVPLVLLE